MHLCHHNVLVVVIVIVHCTCIGFRDSPPTPPSLSRQLESTKYQEHASSGCQQVVEFFSNSLKVLKNFYFLLYLIVAGGLSIFLLTQTL